jgi:hypothetical protein
MSTPTPNDHIAAWTDDLLALNMLADDLDTLCVECEHATHRLEREQVESTERNQEQRSIDDAFSSNA